MSITPTEAARLASDLFGVEGDARPLVADQDANFRIDSSAGSWLLKVSAAGTSRTQVELEEAIRDHLEAAGRGALLQGRVPTVAGDPFAVVETGPEGMRPVRLLTFLPGRPLAKVRPQPPVLLRAVGAALGRLDAALSGFEHPGADRELRWDLRQHAWVGEQLDTLDDADRARVEASLEAFDDRVAGSRDLLPISVIHNDPNDYNLLVTGSRRGQPRLSGLIDLGDAIRTWTAADPAIACAYLAMDKPDPVGVMAGIVGAYHRCRPLTEAELEVLLTLVRVRLSVTVTVSTLKLRAAPDNEYFQVSAEPARRLLDELAEVNERLAVARFRQACGMSAGGAAERLADWLSGPVSAEEVVEGLGRSIVLDLSVGGGDSAADAAAIDARIQAAGARYGIGRYDEARLAYEAPQFEDASGNRTVHLGIDVFGPVGTEVRAPLAGVVHSCADNARPGDYGPTLILEHDSKTDPFYTLYGHLSRDSLEGVPKGKPVAAGEPIGRFGAAAENGGWPPHLHFQLIADLLGHEGDFPGVAAPDQRDVWTDISPDPSGLLGLPRTARSARPPAVGGLVSARRRHFASVLSLSYDEPLHILCGRGAWLFDPEGRRYLDCVNNVAHVGHCHPRVVAAERRQAGLLNTNTRYLHESLVRYTERICGLLPDPLSVCFLVCSGSEANELALRLAAAHTGSPEVLVLEGGYHGNTGSLVALSHYKFAGPGGKGPAPHVHPLPMPYPYRGLVRGADAGVGARYAETVETAVDELLEQGLRPGAWLYEPLLGCGGQVVPPPGYFRRAQRRVREAGGVCIADEVQVGFGRVGPDFWAFRLHDAVPDIVTMGKPIGNGYPLAAVVTTPEIAASFDNGMEYFNTFGGNPVACEVGLAVLDVVQEEGLAEHAADLGEWILACWRELAGRHPLVGEVRGVGLYLGMELVSNPDERTPAPRQAAWVVNRMKQLGFLLSTDGPDHNVLKFKPPLVFSRADAERLTAALDEVLRDDFCRL